MLNNRPIFLEIKIRAVFTIMTDQTTLAFRWGFVITLSGKSRMLCSGTVTGFTLYIGKLRRGFNIDKTLLLKAERVTSNTRRIEGSLFRFERFKCVRMTRFFPDLILNLVTFTAFFRADEGGIFRTDGIFRQISPGFFFCHPLLQNVDLFS